MNPAPHCLLSVRVTPNASKAAYPGWQGTILRVKVPAPALDGRANEMLCDQLSDALKLPRRAITLVRGGTARLKIISIQGLSLEEVKRRLQTDR